MSGLEDNFADIISKAQEGLNLSDKALANKAGITPQQLGDLKVGTMQPEVLVRTAGALGLSGPALLAIGQEKWMPADPEPLAGLKRFESPCGTGLVNAYLAWDEASGNAVLFDTGTDATPILRFVLDQKLRLQMVLLTHSHSDHVADLQKVLTITDCRGFIDRLEAIRGAESFRPGHNFRCGGLVIESRSTPGHSRGGVTYLISGLSRPVAVVGDCLFAGSVGRGSYSFSAAIRSCWTKILSLPGDTVICPGHGPMTTVAEEKLHNPFFAVSMAARAEAA